MPASRPQSAVIRSRAVLYLRQSTHREDSISLELQEHEGRAYAERKGYQVVAVEADPGISGRTWNRPAVQRVMTMVEAHEADVIVLWKWSRLSRSRLDWAVAADKIAAAGGRIESATEPLDTTTSTGRLARGMLTEFAAFESERIGDVWKESHSRRIRNGLPANGKPRFGYTYNRDRGFLPDPVTGLVLSNLYKRYISGVSVYALVRELNAGTIRPVRGYGVSIDGLWSDRTLRRVLDSGFGAGLIRVAGQTVPGAHPPLITTDEWQAYLEARGRRRVLRRTERSEYVLSGLIRCSCGSTMTAGQFGAGHVAKYRCKAARDKGTHDGGYVTAAFVEEHVKGWLVDRTARLNSETAAAAKRAPQIRAVADPTARLRIELAAVLGRIDRLGERADELGMPRDSYQRQLAPLVARQAELNTALLRVEVRSRSAAVVHLPQIMDEWDSLAVPVQRELIRSLIEFVEVFPGRPRATFNVHARQ
ncbi:MAG: hypothetical protein JWR04_2837 [Rhodoglobus sp.]|nr:hypothetical protein [Rhodoglobus sp.]